MPRSTQLTSEEAYRAFLLIELLRSTGEREFPAQLMSVFFWVASHNGCNQKDLVDACNLSRSSVSRCVTWLGPRHRLEHRSGLKLVRRERDPQSYRDWKLYLTPKGDVFVNLLENYFNASIKQASQSQFDQAKQEMDSYDQDDHDDN